MNWENDLKGFAVQYFEPQQKEQISLITYAIIKRLPYKLFDKNNINIPEGWVPCGSVEWVSKILGKQITPNYYPDFLKEYLHRNVWITGQWPTEEGIFVKPADRYKRFTGFITKGGNKGKKKGLLYCSDIISFQNEWRYYISNGKVLIGEWYDGEDDESEAPELNINWPEGFCGAVDFGTLDNGTVALIECQHPFAIGWYGHSSNDKLYIEFLVNGWKYMTR